MGRSEVYVPSRGNTCADAGNGRSSGKGVSEGNMSEGEEMDRAVI